MRWLIVLSLFFVVFVVGYSFAAADFLNELERWECQGELVFRESQQ